MPELPEVETIVSDLRPLLVGVKVNSVRVGLARMVRHPQVDDFIRRITGRKIVSVARQGKYILIGLESDEHLVVHLGMSGQLLYALEEAVLEKHTHAVFGLGGMAELRFRDPRQFGRLLLGELDELRRVGQMPVLGPDPFDPSVTADWLWTRLRRGRASLKAMLLDQSQLSGIGNIYADEACFSARIRPTRRGTSLRRREAAALLEGLRRVLALGIANRGATVDAYRDGWGAKGRQQESLKVYGRGGCACLVCGAVLAQTRLAGRSTVYCRHCQG